MYKEFETKTSYKYLQQVIKALESITKEDYEKASKQLNHSPEEIKRVIELLT